MSDYADALARRNIQPPAQDTASVLAGLVEEMRVRAEQYETQGTASTDLVSFGVCRAIALVEAARRQATTEARAAGGADVPELWWSPSKARETTDLLGGLSYRYVSPGGFETPTNLRDDAVRLVAAPPAPAAHGVAELLALCDIRDRIDREYAVLDTWEIRRLLAPGGADGEGEGT